jgi:hypothetical protein
LNGFSSITIGREDSSGIITLEADATFNSPLILRSPVGNGSINTAGSDLTVAGDVTLVANQRYHDWQYHQLGQAIAITSTLGNINTSAGTLNTVLQQVMEERSPSLLPLATLQQLILTHLVA